jgi:hypothetical protein
MHKIKLIGEEIDDKELASMGYYYSNLMPENL